MLRFTRKPIAWMVGGALMALPALGLPASETGQDIPITDPAMLASLGFEPDATNVYATPQVFEDLLMTPEERAAVQKARLEEYRAAQAGSPAGGSFGTGTAGFSPIAARAIRPERSETEFALLAEGRVCLSGFPVFDAQFDSLPHGARLERVDVWHRDVSDEDIRTSLVRLCRPDNEAGGAEITFLGSVFSSGAGGNGFATIGPLEEDVDLQSCTYIARVVLDETIPVSTCSEGDGLGIQKVRAQWRRQISPPPASPTFGDVDLDHPFFAHIEALAASGITGGCGDGSDFCPDASLTRGQMAVFLAKALGLHWGEISQ